MPDDIGLLSLRHLVPVVADFDAGLHLNLLAAEAVAAAYVLKARIAVTTDVPLIAKASEQLGVDYGVIAISLKASLVKIKEA